MGSFVFRWGQAVAGSSLGRFLAPARRRSSLGVMLEGLDERLVVVVVGLGLSLGLLLIARTRRGAVGRQEKLIPLGSGHRLHVVELEGRRLLIGTGPSGPPQLLTELAELPAWAHAQIGEEAARDT